MDRKTGRLGSQDGKDAIPSRLGADTDPSTRSHGKNSCCGAARWRTIAAATAACQGDSMRSARRPRAAGFPTHRSFLSALTSRTECPIVQAWRSPNPRKKSRSRSGPSLPFRPCRRRLDGRVGRLLARRVAPSAGHGGAVEPAVDRAAPPADPDGPPRARDEMLVPRRRLTCAARTSRSRSSRPRSARRNTRSCSRPRSSC